MIIFVRKGEDGKEKKYIDQGRILVGNTPVLALADGVHYNFFFFNLLATLRGMWDLSSPTRD